MRLFVAIDIPAEARRALSDAVAPLRDRHDELRWTRPASWHLTLAFLGDLPIGGRIRAVTALHLATASAHSCGVTLSGRLGSFRGRYGDRVLWADVEPVDSNLQMLVDCIRHELKAAGVTFDDRPFRAHLTLARSRCGQALPRVRALTGPGLPCQWAVPRVVLMASRVGQASQYRTIATWPLRGVSASDQ
jgi:RNA 2',3'-cyclic 3'-phosphodiesterase